MTIVSQLITRVARELIDEDFVRWSKPTHIDNLNDAISAILIIRPDLGRVTTEQDVSAGQYKVALPSDAYKLLDVHCIDDIAVTFIDLAELNNTFPDWRKQTSDQPERWTRNKRDQTKFFIYPTPTEDIKIEYDYAKKISILDESDTFPFGEIYEAMVFDYMMYRAYSKDGQDSTELAKANSHYQAFTLSLTGKVQADQQVSTPPKEAPQR